MSGNLKNSGQGKCLKSSSDLIKQESRSKKPSKRVSGKKAGSKSFLPAKRGKGTVSTRLSGAATLEKKSVGRRKWVGNRTQVIKWLSRIENADKWKTESGIWTERSLPKWVQKRLRKILKDKDPQGFEEMRRLKIKLGLKKHYEKMIPMEEAVARLGVWVEEKQFMSEGITKFRFVQGGELLNIIATMRASGKTVKEIHEKAGISIETINRVTPEMVRAAKRNFPEAIINAADQKVYHDLIEDKIDKSTLAAEKIASGRRKVEIDVVRAAAKLGKKPKASDLEEMERRLNERFGLENEPKDITGEIEEQGGDCRGRG